MKGSKKYRTNKWIDISVPLKSGMVHWPDDPPVKIERLFDLDQGDISSVSMISMCSHTGTHMDAPIHLIKNGKGLDEMPFDVTVGVARVIEIYDEESIRAEELVHHQIRQGERLLFKTRNSIKCWNTSQFVEDFVYISRDAAEFLVDRKIRVAGIDYLSVDGVGEQGFKTHITLLKAGIWIIEGLDLSGVEHGRYQLICLPLNITRADGAPARAIIKRL
ncbi:MAG: cyclase family protein [bacterium]